MHSATVGLGACCSSSNASMQSRTLRAFHASLATAQAESFHMAVARRVRSLGRPSKSWLLSMRLVFRSRTCRA